jgi:hypothetical protein
MVTFSEAGVAAIFIKAINSILQLSRGMPKLNSVWLVGDCLYLPLVEKGSSRKLLRLLHPAVHPALVGQVLLAEGAFQITFLALD